MLPPLKEPSKYRLEVKVKHAFFKPWTGQGTVNQMWAVIIIIIRADSKMSGHHIITTHSAFLGPFSLLSRHTFEACFRAVSQTRPILSLVFGRLFIILEIFCFCYLHSQTLCTTHNPASNISLYKQTHACVNIYTHTDSHKTLPHLPRSRSTSLENHCHWDGEI